LPGNNKIITELGNNKNYFGSNSSGNKKNYCRKDIKIFFEFKFVVVDIKFLKVKNKK
jgi:hypothetical protein